MRVLGALYGVTLVVSSNNPNPNPNKAARKRTTTLSRKTASKPASRKKTVKKTTPRPTGSPSNAELRAWARQNGFTVSDRGRLPASVVTAYRNAPPA